MTKFSYRFS